MVKKKHLKISGCQNRQISIDITFPSSYKQNKLIIFSHGFKGFKDWGPFNKIAEYFATKGFIFLKFNFSHNGTTAENLTDFVDLNAFGNNNFCKELDDLGFVLEWVDKNLNATNIFLFGHSRGGGISILKSSVCKNIDKVISWSSPSNFVNRLSQEKVSIWKSREVVFVFNARTKQNMPMYYQFYDNCQKNKDRINIKNAIERLKVPILIVHGSADSTVKLDEAQKIKSWNSNVVLSVIMNANHVFGSSHPFKDKDLPTHLKEAIDVTIKFLEM